VALELQVTELKDVPRETILDRDGLMLIPEAARIYGLDVKRLRGYVWTENQTGSLRLPIGDYARDEVYGWSVARLSDHSSGGAS
jgi:hypothetical protein